MRTVAIKAYNGKYVCAENGGKEQCSANRPQVGEWETWDIIPLPPSFKGNNLVCIRSHANGCFWGNELENNQVVIANKMKRADWETFEIQTYGNQARFRSLANGMFVSVNNWERLHANAPNPDPNETFTLEYLDQ